MGSLELATVPSVISCLSNFLSLRVTSALLTMTIRSHIFRLRSLGFATLETKFGTNMRRNPLISLSSAQTSLSKMREMIVPTPFGSRLASQCIWNTLATKFQGSAIKHSRLELSLSQQHSWRLNVKTGQSSLRNNLSKY